MLQRQIPDWEGLELGIACFDAPLIFMVQLGETGGHFATSRAWSRNDYKWFGGFNIVVFSVAFIADD